MNESSDIFANIFSVKVPKVKEENFYKRFLVILADRKKARIFTIYLGDFEDLGEEIVADDVPQKVRKEGFRPGKIARHIRDHLTKHLQYIGNKALEYLIRRRIRQLDGIFIGTHKELFSKVKNCLPKRLKEKVLGEFSMEPNSALGDITLQVISKFNL